MTLGEPLRIFGDVKISFRGASDARFRVQHTRDRYGAPDELTWCDVSRLSDRSVVPETAIDRESGDIGNGGHVLPLLDRVQGDLEIVYRRYVQRPGDLARIVPADWLRVLVGDEYDKEMMERCQAYEITAEPIV